MDAARYNISVKGIVQGVGFRPFVYREALRRRLSGFVLNDSNGVLIEAEGPKSALEAFVGALRTQHPPAAKIDALECREVQPRSGAGFEIVKSRNLGLANTLISPDIATCPDCLGDILDPKNRRYFYPFTNCTNCGPRYTIIEGVPYDRPLTSMRSFEMCPACRREYEDPLDRRYHAQPNACPSCGPRIELSRNGSALPYRDAKTIIEAAAGFLREGRIIAIKGIGGFHLACDAGSEAAIRELRRRKRRDERPFAVMMPDADSARLFCGLSAEEEALLASPQRPIVLLKKLSGRRTPAAVEGISPRNACLGVMLPYTPLHHLLLKCTASPLVMTSANISDEPICFQNEEAFERLKDIADYFLIHKRDIYIRTDDSVVRMAGGKPLMIRRARGYAPLPVAVERKGERPAGPNDADVLAVGAELKNTVCLLKGEQAFIGQHIGDLENAETFESFQKTISHLEKLFDCAPSIIAHDMHPDHLSTGWALAASLPASSASGGLARQACTLSIQHHHAHIASCMAENGVSSPVIGIALDGTGLGTDGNIWGGEILIAELAEFRRAGQFEYIPLPGGDAAIKNPWQTALAYIFNAGHPRSPEEIKRAVPSFRNIPDEKIGVVMKMLERGINSPLTSSCGRLFDAAAALIGVRNSCSFEGQAAMELEVLAEDCGQKAEKCYPYDIKKEDAYITISYIPTINAILKDIQKGSRKEEIAWRFHMTVVSALAEAAVIARERCGISRVALSGGCFQNVILLVHLIKRLEDAGFTVYTHSLVPPNDGGISLGQAVIARAKC